MWQVGVIEAAEHMYQGVALAHVSQENNTPELALGEAISCIASDQVFLSIASPEEVTVLL